MCQQRALSYQDHAKPTVDNMEVAKLVIGGLALVGRLHQTRQDRAGDKGTPIY
jgi:hypothetical protein